MADTYYDLSVPGKQRQGPFPQPGETQVESPQSADPFAAMGGGVQIAGGGWVPKNHPLAQQAQPAAPAATAAPGAAPATPAAPITTGQQATGTAATVGQTTAQGQPTTIAQSFQQALVNRLNPAAVNAQNSAIAPSIEANRLAEDRAFNRNRSMLAERDAATGGGGFDAQLSRLAGERAGREAQFAGNAVSDLAKQQSQEATSSLALINSLLQGQSSQDLQRYGMDLDAALRREGLGAQTSLGNADLALRSRLGEGNLNLGLLSALLGSDYQNRALDQNALQFGASLDQSGLLGILGLL